MNENEIKKTVRKEYGKIAAQAGCGCGCGCGPAPDSARTTSAGLGYTDDQMDAVPEGSNLGLGCGNPTALGTLEPGQTVLDLGSGAGFDCFLAARKVGPKGRVIGVDMTPEMLERARENARKDGFDNVEFRMGEIEHLPVADASVDVIISNCVINLSPDKEKVFSEAFRVLRPGGRLHISDVVLLKPLPQAILQDAKAYVGCVSGAILKDDYLARVKKAGFGRIDVVGETVFPISSMLNHPTMEAVVRELGLSPETLKDIDDSVASVQFTAVKE